MAKTAHAGGERPLAQFQDLSMEIEAIVATGALIEAGCGPFRIQAW